VLQRFDTVSTISGRMWSALLTKGVTPERTRYFPELGGHAANQARRAKGWLSRGTRHSADPWWAVFGQLGEQTGTHGDPAAARLLKSRQDLVFVVCGDGLMKPSLGKPASRAANVRLLHCSRRDGAELLAMAGYPFAAAEPDAADLVLPFENC